MRRSTETFFTKNCWVTRRFTAIAFAVATLWYPFQSPFDRSLQAQESQLPSTVDFLRDIRPIFENHCYGCHGQTKQKSGFRLDIKSRALRGGDNYGPLIDPTSPGKSPLLEWVSNPNPDERMPPSDSGYQALSPDQIEKLKVWIQSGASWPDGIDTTALPDPKAHWSFQPLSKEKAGSSIDDLVAAKLKELSLDFSPMAEPMQWLRRVSLDLHGLPPDQELARWFTTHHQQPQAYDRVVDQLLASPRYAEQWAQHWLDVVRYADTHGFEVNTERPHAWHYRDYVIRALDADIPFKEFIREQIAGDVLGQDTATGFLITASVLLPGQIGADEPSKRLARQDAIDEVVVNMGQSFLGLSIGCARCHDHKFDPITQEDYYAMQAFVAGVEYEDRVVDSPWAKAQRTLQESIDKQLRDIDQRLRKYEPIARPESGPINLPNSAENIIEFEPRAARYVRLEIWDANGHPTLGLIEPCIDELEVWTSGVEAKNVALASLGAKASASGSRESEIHKLQHIHDGKTGNSSSWMSDQPGRGWVLIELSNVELISKIVWGRDRLGQFNDRTATAYRIQIGTDPENLEDIQTVLPLRMPVQPTMNYDRVAPTECKSLRFTVLETNNLEPCIDEIEIYNAFGENIAIEKSGTKVTSSGDLVSPDTHELRFVNDGLYGNSRSWMSNTIGKGSLTFDFESLQTVESIVWGRDREGRYQDRLAIQYRIEVLDSSGNWNTVADHTDRSSQQSPSETTKPEIIANVSNYGLSVSESKAIQELQAERSRLQAQRRSTEENQKAFAGKFRKPDQIHLLHRGDPEQPKQLIPPAIPSFFGAIQLDPSSSDAQRRLAIADWISSDSNPLTPRVIANRIWQGHFGIGLVETSNDFGLNGTPPTNPELLDWLANELIQKNWSLKSLHKRIVLSRTYRQAVGSDQPGRTKDADARFLWSYPRRRIQAEAIRDSMLFVSGQLNLSMYGRGFDLYQQRGGLSGFTPIEEFQGDGLKRMIYAHKVRRERDAVFGAFDCPDAGQSTGLRRTSTTPIQALNLLNSRFTLDQSTAFGNLLRREIGSDPRSLIEGAYERCLLRKATPEEIAEALPVVEQFGIETLCRALFNCNEFLFYP
ncbi:MAG: PSD1 and planctomycete cytochrome C domain-containing protein [Pirellula sp.]